MVDFSVVTGIDIFNMAIATTTMVLVGLGIFVKRRISEFRRGSKK